MSELKTSRPFQERFLDGYDRSELRQEVQRTKRMKGLRKKYATWALGGALAFGGVGAPLMIHNAQTKTAGAQQAPEQETPEKATTITAGIQGDLNAAKSIAEQVAGGVQA